MMMTRIRTALFLLVASAAILLAGCGGGIDPAVLDPSGLGATRTLPNGLIARLSQDSAVVPTGSAVVYTVSLTNAANAPVAVAASRNLATGQIVPRVTLRITDASGALLLQVSRAPSRLTPVYEHTTATLAPGQSISEAIPFSALFIQPGRYAATATFFTDENGAATPVGPLAIVAQ